MGCVFEVAEQRAMERGMEQGMERGLERGIVIGMKTLIKRTSCSAREAVDAFEIAGEEKEKYLKLLEE